MTYGATRYSRRAEVYEVGRSSRLPALRIIRDVLLAGAGDAERVGRHVLGDHATRARDRAVTDLHRGDERGVDARLDIGPDRGAVLVAAVVVGRDVAGAHVRVLADVRVPDVGQVRDLRALADVGVLDLHERARLGLGVQVGVGA